MNDTDTYAFVDELYKAVTTEPKDTTDTDKTTEFIVKKYGVALSPDAVAEILGYHPARVRVLCANGSIPSTKIGNRWYISAFKLASMLNG